MQHQPEVESCPLLLEEFKSRPATYNTVNIKFTDIAHLQIKYHLGPRKSMASPLFVCHVSQSSMNKWTDNVTQTASSACTYRCAKDKKICSNATLQG